MSSCEKSWTDYTISSLLLILAAMAINIGLSYLAVAINLTIPLDNIGTILAALLAGPWIGALAGLLAPLLWALIANPSAAYLAPIGLVVGLTVGILAQDGLFRGWWRALISGVIVAVVASFVAVPISIYLASTATPTGAASATTYLGALGSGTVGSAIVSVLGTNLADKVFGCLVSWAIVELLPPDFARLFLRAWMVRGEPKPAEEG